MQSQILHLNVKVYLDDPTLLPNAHVSELDATALMNDLNAILLDDDITLNVCYELLPDVSYFNNPDNFLSDWPVCNDGERISVYIRKGGTDVAGESFGIGKMWSQGDLSTLTHEFGHVLGLQHTNFNSVNVCASEMGENDGIDDTPYHPQLFQTGENGDLEGIPGYFTGCSVNWLVVKDPCDVPVIDQSANQTVIDAQVLLYQNNLEKNAMAQIYHPLQTTCIPKDFTDEQGESMRSWIQSRLRRFLANGAQGCNVSNWTSVNSDINVDTDFTGVVIIENTISINANVSFSDGLVLFKGNTGLTLGATINVTLSDVIIDRYNVCAVGGSPRMIVEQGCHYDFNLVQFRDFFTNGIELNSDLGSINQVLFSDSPLTINNLGNLGSQNDGLWLTDILCNRSDIIINNSRVAFHGAEFRFSDIEAIDSEVFTQTSATPRRTTFYSGSRIIYNSGGKLQVDETFFESEGTEPMIQVFACDDVVICRSSFTGTNESPDGMISVSNATEHMIFENVIDGENTRSIELNGSGFGMVQNNVFQRSVVGVHLGTSGTNYNLDCNFHVNNDTAWQLDTNVSINRQGMENVPALNKFINTETHVENTVNFEYLFDPLNPDAPEQLRAVNVLLTTEATNFILAPPMTDICLDQNEIIGEWETWEGCAGDFFYEWDAITCGHACSCCAEPTLPIYIDEEIKNTGMIAFNGLESFENLLVSSLPQSNENTFKDLENEFLSSSDMYPNPTSQVVNIDIEQPGLSKLKVYNNLGQLIIEKELDKKLNKIDLSKYPGGEYLFHLSSPNQKTVIKRIFKI